MYNFGFKFWVKELWFTFLCASAMVVGSALLFISITNAQTQNLERMTSAPCIDFNGKPIQEVPARCFGYFSEHK